MRQPIDIPWLTDASIASIGQYISADMYILEFGAGGSTVWFSQRCRVVTIEHDQKWLTAIAEHVNEANSERLLLPRPYWGVCKRWKPETFDLVLVDGRDRVGCAKYSLPLLKPGGLFVLDNAERRHYRSVGDELCSGWRRSDYEQHGPLNDQFPDRPLWKTSIWEKPE